MVFPYKQVLMVGATAGIGAAMADRLVKEGVKVIAVGRRQDRLDAFVQKHGSDRSSRVRFDINQREKMDEFVSKVTKDYPDLDCVFLNAGVQSTVNLAQPEKVDLASFHSEFSTNFNSFVDLSVKFLPFLMQKQTETGLIFTTSNLAFVAAPSLPAYSASKAALNSFILCLREQLRSSSVKVIELSPPAVQTELHDYMGEERGRSFGMPIDQFTDLAYNGLESGREEVIVGSIGPANAIPAERFNEVLDKRRDLMQSLIKVFSANAGK